MSRTNSAGGINVQHPKTKSDFERIHKTPSGGPSTRTAQCRGSV